MLLLTNAVRSVHASVVDPSANPGEQDLQQENSSWRLRLELG